MILFGNMRDIAGTESDGTVLILSRVTRESTVAPGEMITREIHREPVEDGAFRIEGLDPGPVTVEVTAGAEYSRWDLNLPEGDGEHNLVDLVSLQVEWEPEVVGRAQAAQRAAEAAAGRSEAGADRVGSAEAVLAARAEAVAARDEAVPASEAAVSARAEAVAAAEAAREDAEQAALDREATSADRVKTTADATATAADRTATAADRTATTADRTATGQARSQAWSAADRADTAATTATTQADRARTEADRAAEAAENVDTAAIRQEVTTQIAAVVDGAPEDLDTIREVAEYAQENRTITDTLNAAIGQKADKTHTHTVSDVTGLQGALDGKAPTSHTHTADQVTMTADNGQAVSVQEVIVGLVEALPTAPEVTIVPVDTMPPAAEQLPGTLYIRYGGA